MREDFSFDTVENTGDYTLSDMAIADHRYWHTDTFRMFDATIGVADEQYMIEWAYPDFRNIYRFGLQTAPR